MSYLRGSRSFWALAITGVLVVSLPALHSSAQNRSVSPPQKKEPTASKSEPNVVVRISTQLVQIDAVVTDKDEQHVDDLSANDFELLVDGKAQTISHFALVNAARLGAPNKKEPPASLPIGLPSKPIQPEQVKRTIALVVDDLSMSYSSMQAAQKALRKFIEEQMREGDLVGIICTGRGIGSLQQFTNDRRILDAAIERLVWNPMSRGSSEFGIEFGDTDKDELEKFRETIFTVGTLGAMNFVVRSLRELPGRKAVILISDGFGFPSQEGESFQMREQMRRLVDLANRSSVVIYSLDSTRLTVFRPPSPMWPAGPSPASGNSVPPILRSPTSLPPPSRPMPQPRADMRSGLIYLAHETGGLTMLNNNDLNASMRRALHDTESYYLLGFDPQEQQFEKRYHAIKVRLKRPGLHVRSRAGYFGIVDEEIKDERHQIRDSQIVAALYSPFGARDLKLQMTSFFLNLGADDPHAPQLVSEELSPSKPPRNAQSSTGVSFVRSLFHLDCSQLTFKDKEPGRKSVTLELVAFAFNEDGLIVDQHGRSVSLSFNEKQYRAALAKGLVYTADIPIHQPGAYQFRAVLRDAETGRLGSATQFLQIPDLDNKRLALSGLALSAPQAAPSSVPLSGDPSASAAPSVEASDTQPTLAVRRFAHTSEMVYDFMIFNAQLDKRTHQPQLTSQTELFRDGQRVYQFPARPVDASEQRDLTRLVFGGRLELKDFPPGDYALRVIVTDTLAKQKYSRAEQWMDFSVK